MRMAAEDHPRRVNQVELLEPLRLRPPSLSFCEPLAPAHAPPDDPPADAPEEPPLDALRDSFAWS
jgi:hypothetical protein